MAERGNHEILLETGTNEIEIMEFTIDGNLYGINVAKVREIRCAPQCCGRRRWRMERKVKRGS